MRRHSYTSHVSFPSLYLTHLQLRILERLELSLEVLGQLPDRKIEHDILRTTWDPRARNLAVDAFAAG